MRDTARSLGDKALRFSPGQAISSRRAEARLTVLAYHGVEDGDTFRRQLDYLTDVATFVSLDQAIAHTRRETDLPRRPVLVTFDDGDPTALSVAAPELHRRGIPAVAFVVPGYLGSDRPFWWEEVAMLEGSSGSLHAVAIVQEMKSLSNTERVARIEALRARHAATNLTRDQLGIDDLARLETLGIEIGNHTYTHPILTRCDPDVVDNEITTAHRILEEHLGHPIRAFAYPNGDHDPMVVDAVKSCGYDVAFCFDHALEPLPVRDPLLISRVRVSSTTSIDRLSIIVSGLHPWLHRRIGRS